MDVLHNQACPFYGCICVIIEAICDHRRCIAHKSRQRIMNIKRCFTLLNPRNLNVLFVHCDDWWSCRDRFILFFWYIQLYELKWQICCIVLPLFFYPIIPILSHIDHPTALYDLDLTILHWNIDQILVNSLQGLMNFEIGWLD